LIIEIKHISNFISDFQFFQNYFIDALLRESPLSGGFLLSITRSFTQSDSEIHFFTITHDGEDQIITGLFVEHQIF